MISPPTTRETAFETLGILPDSNMAGVKAAFREQVKALHPDRVSPTPEILAKLANAIAAVRILENEIATTPPLPLTPGEAENGATRVVSLMTGNHIVRIPPGSRDGDRVMAVGFPTQGFVIELEAEQPVQQDVKAPNSTLPEFAERFATPSPVTRFAGWLRRKPTAA